MTHGLPQCDGGKEGGRGHSGAKRVGFAHVELLYVH
jgi:hypothetical protein